MEKYKLADVPEKWGLFLCEQKVRRGDETILIGRLEKQKTILHVDLQPDDILIED